MNRRGETSCEISSAHFNPGPRGMRIFHPVEPARRGISANLMKGGVLVHVWRSAMVFDLLLVLLLRSLSMKVSPAKQGTGG